MSGIAFAADPTDAAGPMARLASEADPGSLSIASPASNCRIAAWSLSRNDLAHRPKCFDGRLWVAVDGEIYGERGPIPEPQDIVAEHLRRGDLAQLHRLNGSFAAIAYDTASSQLTLIADRLSTRPLYLWADGPRIAAASRVSHLLADDRVPRQVSEAGLLEVLVHQRTFAHHTIYRAIEGLSCGEVLAVSGGAVKRRQISRPAWTGRLTGKRRMADELAQRMSAAMRRRVSDGSQRHCLLLSGGLDSRMVLAAAGADAPRIHCLTVSAWENTETRVAKEVADRAGAPFTFLRSDPEAFHELVADGSRAVDALMPAPLALTQFYPEMGRRFDVAFCGHFLDIMFRGTYQPKAYIRLPRSRAALPRHRKVLDGGAETVAREHHIRTELPRCTEILSPGARRSWKEAQIEGLRAALALADYDDPYDAFDVFCLHAQGRHHSNSDFLSLNPFVRYRVPALDRDLFDLYLDMPAAARVGQGVALRAMAALSPKLFALADAGTGKPGTTPPMARVSWALFSAAMKRLGLRRGRKPPKAYFTEGSWVDWTRWMREEPGIRAKLMQLPESAALLDLGIFDRGALRALIDDVVAGRRAAPKLLHQLLTFDAWFARYPSRGGIRN